MFRRDKLQRLCPQNQKLPAIPIRFRRLIVRKSRVSYRNAEIENLPAHLLRLCHTPAEREPFRLSERAVNFQRCLVPVVPIPILPMRTMP